MFSGIVFFVSGDTLNCLFEYAANYHQQEDLHMPFESGSLALSVFYLSDKLPEDYLERFASHNAGMLDNVKDEPQVGWVSGRTLLETRIDEQTAICGGHIYLNIRSAERKVPSILLKAICQREELAFMAANESDKVPSKVKKEIREEALEKHLMKMPPVISGTPFVIDTLNNVAYLGTASPKQIDLFVALFYKTMGIEPIQLTVNELMFRQFQLQESDIPEVAFSETTDSESIAARDFLTWLWYYSEKTCGGKISLPNYGDFEMLIEAPLTFAFASEAKGAAETAVKKGGSPLRSAEVKAALTVGKKLKKAKLTLCRGQDLWTGSFDADKFAFSGLSLPVGEEMERNSRFAERVMNLKIFNDAMVEYFRIFVEAVRGSDWETTEKDIIEWTRLRDSY